MMLNILMDFDFINLQMFQFLDSKYYLILYNIF